MSSRKHSDTLFSERPQFDLDNLQYCDVRLFVGDRTFEAHKFMLANSSPFFSAMFADDFKEKQENEALLKAFEADVFQEVLRFIYNGQINGFDEINVKLLVAADFLQMDSLKEVCVKNMCPKLSASNCLEFLEVANLTNADALKTEAFKYISHFESRIGEDALKALFKRNPELGFELFSKSSQQRKRRRSFSNDNDGYNSDHESEDFLSPDPSEDHYTPY